MYFLDSYGLINIPVNIYIYVNHTEIIKGNTLHVYNFMKVFFKKKKRYQSLFLSHNEPKPL